MQYRFTCDYTSGVGSWNEGDLAEFDDATAAWLQRDVPGCIVPVNDPTPKASNRQVKAAPKQRG